MTDESALPPAPEGWVFQTLRGGFGEQAGPFYFRKGALPGVGFFAAARHLNLGGVVHGGAMLTLADISLWDICQRAAGAPFKGVTVTLNAEFVGPGGLGQFIEASGEIVRMGKSLWVARGLISADNAALMSFSGTLKRFP